MQWEHEHDNRGTMQARREQGGIRLLVTRAPLYACQMEAFEVSVVVTDGKRALAGKVDVRTFEGNGKPVSANEQAFDVGKQIANELSALFA